MKILTVTAHPDDEILGFGGSSWVLTQKGNEVHHLILSGNVDVRRNRPEVSELVADIESANKEVGSTFELRDFYKTVIEPYADLGDVFSTLSPMVDPESHEALKKMIEILDTRFANKNQNPTSVSIFR